MKKWVGLFLCIGLLLGATYFYNHKPSNKLSVYEYTLNFKNAKIYVKTSTSEHYEGTEIIAFSSKPITNDIYAVYNGNTQRYDYCDDRNILVYYQGGIFYKISQDTLFIYSVLKGFGNLPMNSKKVKIVPIESQIHEWRQYQANPRKYGLTKICAHK